jgi:AraC-like DNA-binding protein
MKSDRVPTQFAATLLKMAAERGYDFSSLLVAAGLDFDPLDTGSSAWRAEISAMQYSRLYQQTLSLLQDETFGLHPHKVVSPGAFRMMCYCIIYCENLGKAIRRATEFYRTFFDEDAQLYANFSEAYARVGYRDMGADRGERRGEQLDAHRVDAVDAYGLSIWHRFFGWLIGRPISLQRVDFVGEPPISHAKYSALFGCPLNFRQPSNLLYFDSEYLKLPLVHTEHSLNDFLRTAPYQLLTMTRQSHEDSLITQVRAMIGHDFSQGFPGFETISAALNISAPTLRRRLKREGTTFQQLKDDCRCDAARDLLGRADRSINAVALELGFTDPSTFHRSFKKWTGQTPGEFRASLPRS